MVSMYASTATPSRQEFATSAHRTGRAGFPHPALRRASHHSMKRQPQVHLPQSKNAQLADAYVGRRKNAVGLFSPRRSVASFRQLQKLEGIIKRQQSAIMQIRCLRLVARGSRTLPKKSFPSWIFFCIARHTSMVSPVPTLIPPRTEELAVGRV